MRRLRGKDTHNCFSRVVALITKVDHASRVGALDHRRIEFVPILTQREYQRVHSIYTESMLRPKESCRMRTGEEDE